MYRLLICCLLLVESRGFHKPNVQNFPEQAHDWNLKLHHHINTLCGSMEQKPTNKPDVTEEPVTENGKKPFRDDDEDQKEPGLIPEKTFEYLANKTVKNNKVNKNFCKVHSKEGALENFTPQNYKLIIPLKDYDADDIIVKVKNNMVYIKAQNGDVDIDIRFGEGNVFEAIYKIPDIVDVKRVYWNYSKGRLEILCYYKIQFNEEVPKSCDGDYSVDDELRSVQRIDHDAISEIFKV